ncbi:hypothetical protein [Streptomyces sp. NBC_01012]|uniref:hypothetical protein n=1 Tax=Streptomyces sp. NBC_01012 TaxID=2903717 RepID=UPI00386F2453|nr:hypothetical protein OG623_20750 [Streptomyces sp. NBC_01012]
MHGYGNPPERRPSSSTLVTLRVVFASLTVLSCGFFAWAAMLRLAIVTRRKRDWLFFGLVLMLNIGYMGFSQVAGEMLDTLEKGEPAAGAEGAAIALWMTVVVVGSVAYYLYADIRHYASGRGRPSTGPLAEGPQAGAQKSPQVNPYASPYGAGQPGAVPGFGPAPDPRTPGYGYPPAPQPSSAPTPPTSAQPGPSGPAEAPRAAPQRLDQVRAELDELSDYLRKEGGGK